MSRKITFRAWDSTEKKMRKPIDLENVGDTFVFTKSTGFAFQYDPTYEKRDVEIMQFTGLCDKNGKEIYEGDILCLSRVNYIVEWETLRAGWFGQRIDEKTGHSWGLSADGIQGMEVIGNIYENPELLK